MTPFTLTDFVAERNRIEGITRAPWEIEVLAHVNFLTLEKVTIPDLALFVRDVAPGAVLRDRKGLDVRVGKYTPPPGGPQIRSDLELLLDPVAIRYWTVYDIHIAYETLHPFTDGNGRSGRALWLWQMGGIEKVPLGFLHTFYYQALGASR